MDELANPTWTTQPLRDLPPPSPSPLTGAQGQGDGHRGGWSPSLGPPSPPSRGQKLGPTTRPPPLHRCPCGLDPSLSPREGFGCLQGGCGFWGGAMVEPPDHGGGHPPALSALASSPAASAAGAAGTAGFSSCGSKCCRSPRRQGGCPLPPAPPAPGAPRRGHGLPESGDGWSVVPSPHCPPGTPRPPRTPETMRMTGPLGSPNHPEHPIALRPPEPWDLHDLQTPQNPQ